LTGVVNIGGANEILAVPGLPLQSGGQTEVDCSELLEAYRGKALISCTFGAATVDAFDCIRDCMPKDHAEVRFNGVTYKLSPASRLETGEFEDRPCSSLDPGYGGNLNLACGTGGVLTADTAECAEQGCGEGQVVSVSVGSSNGEHTLSESLLAGSLAALECASFNPDFEGSIMVSCVKGAPAADTSGCTPQAGKGEVEEVVVLKTAMSLALPTIEAHRLTTFRRPWILQTLRMPLQHQ
jgi:hypothetical protein